MKQLPFAATAVALFAATALVFAALPSLRPLVLFPAVLLLASLAWWLKDVQRKVRRSEREKFLSGICVQCGYDTRGNRDRCSECGAVAWTPDKPLAAPDVLWPEARRSLMAFVAPGEVVRWMLEQRHATPWQVWGDDPNRRRVASALVHACQRADDGPFGKFLPDDPFRVLSSGITAGSFIEAVREILNVDLSPEDLYELERMTLAQATSFIAVRVPARRFYTRRSIEAGDVAIN